MEGQLFDWKSWDTIDTMDFFFYDCELLVPVGQYPIGTKIKSIAMMYGSGVMEFYAEEENSPTKTDTFTPMKVIATFNLFVRAVQIHDDVESPQ
jgi:hypothetical protein